MRRLLLGLVAVAAVLAPLSSDANVAPAARGCSKQGALRICLSSPASRHGNDAVVEHGMRGLFRSAGAGDTIRVAMFRWDIDGATKDLLAAQARGATVYLVADHDVVTNPAGRRLVRTLEHRDPTRHNVVVCKGSCLPGQGRPPAPPGQNIVHLKLVLTDIGGERATVSSSLNLERRQHSQYNSLVRIVDAKLYAFELDYFYRLRKQHWRGWREEDKVLHHGQVTAQVYPSRRDLLLQTLRGARCVPGARDVDVMIAVIQRYDIRSALGGLHRQGCRLNIVTTRDRVETWLERPFRDSSGHTVDLPDDRVRTVSSHDKVVALHVRFHGAKRYLVVTGTSNSTCGGLLYNDEEMLRIENRWAYREYRAHVLDAFSRAHQSRVHHSPTQAHCR